MEKLYETKKFRFDEKKQDWKDFQSISASKYWFMAKLRKNDEELKIALKSVVKGDQNDQVD